MPGVQYRRLSPRIKLDMQMPNPLSFASIPLTTLGQGGTKIGQATGFFYRSKKSNRLHLITNWHVVTGRDPNKPTMSKTGAIPEVVQCLVHERQPSGGDGKQYVRLSALSSVDVKLNDPDGNQPCWNEHRDHGHAVDVVAIDVEDTFSKDEHSFNAVNGGNRFEENYHGSVTDDVFVIGYPLGLSGSRSDRGAMPIYKRGSIASEPAVNYNLRPCLLIDCRTFSGMSGSPVVVSHSGLWTPPGKTTKDSIIGTVENLLGVYSGRMSSPITAPTEGISDIGIVWKIQTVEDIVDNGVRGSELGDILQK